MGAGLYAGLYRIGWPLPAGGPLAEIHGPLMVSGFFGTVISLERAVALGRPWAYLAPFAAALGALALLMGAPPIVGAGLFVFSGLSASINALAVLRLQPALFTTVMLVGALGWLAGNYLLMVGVPVISLVGWWLVFFVATIAAERLELSRFMRTSHYANVLFGALIVVVVSGAIMGLDVEGGANLMGAGFLALSLWLWRYDVARSTIRRSGQTRFFATSLLAGYAWLGVAGLLALLGAVGSWPFGYDLVLHLTLIGFVLSMVFAHALIILPAVTGMKLTYSPSLYGPLFLLYASVAMRLVGGSLEIDDLRLASSVITVLAIASFAVTLALSSLRRSHRNA